MLSSLRASRRLRAAAGQSHAATALFRGPPAPHSSLASGSSRAFVAVRQSPTAAALPSIDEARAMPRHVSEMSGEAIVMLAESGSHTGAIRERLRREIMAVDNCKYEETTTRVLEMEGCANVGLWRAKSPYQIGVVGAFGAGWISLPLVFHLPTAHLFNDYCVTAMPPEVGACDTALEVGSWSWSWMEPPLGTISFFLLCMQFVREQRKTLRHPTLTEKLYARVADRVTRSYPQYNERVVRSWAESTALYEASDEIKAEGQWIEARLRGDV